MDNVNLDTNFIILCLEKWAKINIQSKETYNDILKFIKKVKKQNLQLKMEKEQDPFFPSLDNSDLKWCIYIIDNKHDTQTYFTPEFIIDDDIMLTAKIEYFLKTT